MAAKRPAHRPATLTETADPIQAAVVARVRQLGLTGSELAARSGVSQQAISGYLTGRRSMTSANLANVLTALGLSIRPARPS